MLMPDRKPTVMFFAVIVLLLLAACGANNENASTENVSEEETTFSIEAFGVVKVTRERTIAISFPAMIAKIHVIPGQKVTLGSPLMTLNVDAYEGQKTALRNKIEIARLRLNQIRTDYEKSDVSTSSELKRLENSIASTQQEIGQLEQEYDELRRNAADGGEPETKKLKINLEMARRELAAAEDNLNRKNILFRDGTVSEKELEHERNAVEALRSTAKNLELSIESAENQLRQALNRLQLQISQKTIQTENLDIQIDQLSAPEITNIEIQKAQISAHEEEMDRLLLLSELPFLDNNQLVSDVENGIVHHISGHEGEPATNGIALVTILDLATLVVEAGVPEEFIKDISLDDAATIKPLADPDRSYSGRVIHIAGAAEARSGETVVNIILEVPDHDGFLIPNFNVDIEFAPAQNDEDSDLE